MARWLLIVLEEHAALCARDGRRGAGHCAPATLYQVKIFLGSLVMHGSIFFSVAWTTAPFWFFLPFGLWQSRRRRCISSGDVGDMLSQRNLFEKLPYAGKPTELGAKPSPTEPSNGRK